MDVNVNVHFDENFVNALSDIAGCLAAVSVANSGNLNAHLPEKTVEPPKAPAKPAKKAEPKKDTKAEEKPPTGEPVSPAKAKEINEAIKTPSKEDMDKPTTEEIEAIRGKAGEFMKADKATNQPKIAAWLKENGLKRVGEIETRVQIDSLKALIGGDKVA